MLLMLNLSECVCVCECSDLFIIFQRRTYKAEVCEWQRFQAADLRHPVVRQAETGELATLLQTGDLTEEVV